MSSSTATYELHAEPRDGQGKAASRRLRLAGKVIANVYGGGRPPQALMLEERAVRKQFRDETTLSHVLSLEVAGEKKPQQVLIRELQHHPWKNQIFHIDFMRISADREIQVHVPLRFIGEEECAGVKKHGILSHVELEILVACLPKDLPEGIDVDVSGLDVGESVHISDLTLPQGVESIDMRHGAEHDRVLAAVHPRSVVTEEEGEAAEAAEAAEAEGEEGAEKAADKDQEESSS